MNSKLTFRAFDTETANRPGHGEAVLLVKQGKCGPQWCDFPRNFDVVYSFLRDGKWCAWNMDFDVRAIIHPKFIPWRVVEKLGLEGHATWKTYKFKYVPAKFLEVHGPRGGFTVYDLKQFYGLFLSQAAKAYLSKGQGKGKIPKFWYNEMDLALCDNRREQVIDYACRDVVVTQHLLDKLLSSMSGLGIVPDRLSSCASLARHKYGTVLQKQKPPEFLNRFYEDSYFGGRIEVGVLGAVGPCKLWDIHGAYPSIIAGLREIHRAEFSDFDARKGGKWQDKGATYGAYEVLAQVPESWIWGPFAYHQSGKIVYPVGDVRTWVSRPGIETLKFHGIRFKVLRAHEVFCPENAKLVFPDMAAMFNARKDASIGLAVKLCMNSIYGLMAEKSRFLMQSITGDRRIDGEYYKSVSRYGKCANFIYAAHVTEAIRMKIWEILHSAGRKAYFAATDGILTDANYDIPTGDGLGEWGLKGEYKQGIILGCGRYFLDGPKPEYHLRGFPVDRRIFRRMSETQKPELKIYQLTTGSLREWALNPTLDLNVLAEYPKILKLADDKREWKGKLKTLADAWKIQITSLPFIALDLEDSKNAGIYHPGRKTRRQSAEGKSHNPRLVQAH